MSNIFLRAYSAVAQAIAQNTGVTIKTGANGFYTDGETIHMPTVDANSIGPLIHEVGHIKKSDFSLTFLTPLEKHLSNLFEDIRIEYSMGIDYPGARMYLADMVEHLVGSGFFSAPSDEDPNDLMQKYMLYRLRSDVLGQVGALEYSNAAESLLQAKMPPGLMVKLNALMYRVERATCESDCKQIAQAVITMMEEEAKKEEDEEDKQQPADSNSDPNQGQQQVGADAKGDAQQQGDAPQAAKDKSPGESADGGPASSSTPGADEGKKEQSFLRTVLGAGEDDGMADIKDVLKKACQQAVDEGRIDTVGMPFVTKTFDRPSAQVSSTMLNDVNAATNALKVKTQALLQAETTSSKRSVFQGTRIDPRKLHRAPTGGAIFSKVQKGKKHDTVIEVLVDRSTSMAGEPMTLAMRAALAAALSFNHHGVETAVMAFPYKGGNALLKGFSDRAAAQVDKFEAIQADGGTPMAEAIMGACIELAKHRFKRKILLVATDGDPAKIPPTKEAISLARRAGMDVLGVGIKIDVAKVFGEKFSTQVNNIDELPTAIVNVLRGAVFN